MSKNKCCTPKVRTKDLIESLSATNAAMQKELATANEQLDQLRGQVDRKVKECQRLGSELADAKALISTYEQQSQGLREIINQDKPANWDETFDNAIARIDQLEQERDAAVARAEAAEKIVKLAKLFCTCGKCGVHNNGIIELIDRELKATRRQALDELAALGQEIERDGEQ